MKRFLIATLLLLAWPAVGGAHSWAGVYADARAGVLPVSVKHGETYVTHCTATVVAVSDVSKTIGLGRAAVITERHCAADAAGAIHDLLFVDAVAVVRVDELGFGLVELVPDAYRETWAPLQISAGARPGSPVAIMGYPYYVSTAPAISAGELTLPLSGDPTLEAQIAGPLEHSYFSLPFYQGNSGGPIVDTRGRVLSILRAGFRYEHESRPPSSWLVVGVRHSVLASLVESMRDGL